MTVDRALDGRSDIRSDLRITMIGPMPPPIDGQSIVMSHMFTRLSPHFPCLRVADISARTTGWWRVLANVARSVAALQVIRGADVVYVAVKADRGMWLTTATAAVARLARTRIFLHHHSYTYIRQRKARMVALSRVAGKAAEHIVLSRTMAGDLRAAMPEVRRTRIIGNAALVDQTLLDLPLKSDNAQIVLGHLSNLYLDKGIAEVVELTIQLHAKGIQPRLIVGGPVVDSTAQVHLDRAGRLLGPCFEYRGQLQGEAKRDFFREITHFVFPSAYVHESVPLVLYEAMAAGVVCVATTQGSIAEQLAGSPGILAKGKDSFVEDVLPVMMNASVSSKSSAEARESYACALAEANDSVNQFISTIEHGYRRRPSGG